MEARHRLFDDISKIATSAAGIVQGAGQEVEQMIRQRLDRLVDSLDLVTREEFDAVKAMAEAARLENEALAKRIARLEGGKGQGAKSGKPKAVAAKAKAGTAKSKDASKKTTGAAAKSKAASTGSASRKSGHKTTAGKSRGSRKTTAKTGAGGANGSRRKT